MNKTTVGEFLKNSRETRNLSQGDVARALGYSCAQYVSNVERGVCRPSKKKLKDWAEIVGVKPKKLVTLMVDEYKSDLMLHVS